jgi:hypothetical protein
MAIEVDDGPLPLAPSLAGQLAPHRRLDLVVRRAQPFEAVGIHLGIEAPQEVPRRGGIGNPHRPQKAKYSFVVLKRRLVLQTRPA